jgi:hypothetical protein
LWLLAAEYSVASSHNHIFHQKSPGVVTRPIEMLKKKIVKEKEVTLVFEKKWWQRHDPENMGHYASGDGHKFPMDELPCFYSNNTTTTTYTLMKDHGKVFLGVISPTVKVFKTAGERFYSDAGDTYWLDYVSMEEAISYLEKGFSFSMIVNIDAEIYRKKRAKKRGSGRS